MSLRRAFTLIELLIVVAIIAILAAIAVPNFLEAQTRARVSRTENDLRTISLGMESYRIDNNGYIASDANSPITPHGTASGADTRLLSTPISYLTSMPPDVFRIVAGNSNPIYRIYALAYYTSTTGAQTKGYGVYPHNAWMTWSQGPDIVTQSGGYRSFKAVEANERATPPLLGAQTPPELGGGGTLYNGMRYDPTNGTVSVGDIHRWEGLAKTEL